MTEDRGFVLDAGAFIQLERRDKTMVALAKKLLDARTALVTSAAVVAQVWRTGDVRQVPIAMLLRRTKVIDLTHPVARVLGRMLAASRADDPIDAHVVFLARERDWPVLTSDPHDLLTIDPGLDVQRI